MDLDSFPEMTPLPSKSNQFTIGRRIDEDISSTRSTRSNRSSSSSVSSRRYYEQEEEKCPEGKLLDLTDYDAPRWPRKPSYDEIFRLAALLSFSSSETMEMLKELEAQTNDAKLAQLILLQRLQEGVDSFTPKLIKIKKRIAKLSESL